MADVIGFEDEVGEVPGSKVHGMKHNICKSVVNVVRVRTQCIMKRDALRRGMADVIGFEVHGMKHNICKSVVNVVPGCIGAHGSFSVLGNVRSQNLCAVTQHN